MALDKSKEHNIWFINQVQKALDEANNENVVWLSNEKVFKNCKKRILNLKKNTPRSKII
jgi:hypothetical protein